MGAKVKAVSLVIVIVLLALTACKAAQPVEPVVPAEEKSLRELQNGKPFIYVGNGLGHPVISIFILGFLEACRDYDVECETMVGSGFEDSAYLSMLDQAIAQ